MSVPLDEVVSFLDDRLEVSRFDEKESNGLIVRGSNAVTRVAAAVNTCFYAISEAKNAGADLLLVHQRSWPEIDLELVAEKLGPRRPVAGLDPHAVNRECPRRERGCRQKKEREGRQHEEEGKDGAYLR